MLGASLVAVACWDEPSPRASTAAVASCEIERRPLTLEDGTEIYVEPENLIRVGDVLLLAGSPTYTWSVDEGRDAILLSRSALAAATLGASNSVVRSPIRGLIGAVRMVALERGGWAAILSEVEPDASAPSGPLLSVWYAEHDGRRWTHLEEVPIPSGSISVGSSSDLVRVGERTVWAAVQTEPGVGLVHVYERVGGRWRASIARVGDRAELASIAYGTGDLAGLWVLVTGEDPHEPGFQKSIRLYHEGSLGSGSWELVQRVAMESEGSTTYWPRVALHSTDISASWVVMGADGGTAMARVGMRPGSPGRLVVLDDAADYLHPLTLSEHAPAWIVSHFNPIVGTRELRLLQAGADGPVRLASARSPFTGFFAALAMSDREVLVVGPEMGLVPTETPVRSLILRLSTSC